MKFWVNCKLQKEVGKKFKDLNYIKIRNRILVKKAQNFLFSWSNLPLTDFLKPVGIFLNSQGANFSS